jgi:steroid 5-alpha reductase family enzyme
MGLTSLLALNAALLGASFSGLWLLSLRKRDVSIVDAFWGPAFAAVAWVDLAATTMHGLRPVLVTSLLSVWGLRLGGHLYSRNRGKPEDHRYAAMRAEHGPAFARRSLVTVFWLQAGLVLLISSPVPLIALSSARLTLLDAVAAAAMLSGIAIETVADLQLSRFRRDPGNRGTVLSSGLWRYSRHPNYFGDALCWWGMGLFSVAAGSAWGLLGPALMTFLLLKVSGVTLLERDIAERRPGYAEYVARTSAFIPWPPRRPVT